MSNIKLRYNDGVNYCQKEGKRILTLENMQIYSDLEQLIVKNRDSLDEYTYVGGFRTGPGKPWTWQSGAILNYNLKWAPNEPNNLTMNIALVSKTGQVKPV